MLYREIMAVCSEIHTKHINTAVWAERRFVNVKLAVHIVTIVRYIWWKLCGTYSDHLDLDVWFNVKYLNKMEGSQSAFLTHHNSRHVRTLFLSFPTYYLRPAVLILWHCDFVCPVRDILKTQFIQQALNCCPLQMKAVRTSKRQGHLAINTALCPYNLVFGAVLC